MQNSIIEIFQLIEKAIEYALADAYYLMPVIGSIQLFLIGIFFKRKKLTYLSLFLFLLFCSIFPFAKLIPNLGSDAFSEFQKINLDEVYFYIKTLNFFAGWSVKHYILWFLIICVYITSIIILFFISKKITFFNFLKTNYFIVVGIILIPTTLNLYKVSILYNSSIIEKENQLKNIDYKLDTINIKLDKSRDLSVFLYIGEATSRLHWSLYDYFRSTNINLENFSNSNQLIIYDNIHSTHTHTSPSLMDALTIKANTRNDNLKLASEKIRYSLIDILNSTSITTSLYSTQAKSGSWNLASSLIFKNANNKIYSTKYNLGNANYINKDKPYDHVFLKELTKEIDNSLERNNFYVFHSYAGHGNYKKNIPKEYHKNIDDFYSRHNNKAIFGKEFRNNQKEFLENYDSAMNYISDNIVYSLNEISKKDKPIVFIYTSDHGESPLTGRAHDSSRFIWEMASVPFLVYFNDAAKLKYPELFKNIELRSLKKNRNLLSNLPSLILELFNIKIFDENSNLMKVSVCKFGNNDCFEDYHIIRKQLNSLGVVRLDYPIENNESFIDNTDRPTTFSNMKNYFSKIKSDLEICSHRTNSIARFIRFNSILNCMEIDVIIENDYLDVRHSTEKSTSLNLEDLIRIQKEKENILWLDVKQIKDVNQCEQLLNILKNIHSKNEKINLFIEFPSSIINKISSYEKCISDIKSMNFIISFYIPNNVKSECIEEQSSQISNDNRCQYLNKILKKINNSNLFSDISFDYKNYDILKDNELIDNFTLNTWHIPDEIINLIDDKRFRLVIPFNDGINYN